MGNVTRLEYHVVLVTKYRKPALRGIEQAVYAALVNATRGQDFEVVQMGCDDGNHVHLVIKTAPTVAVEQVVRRLKQLTTLELWSTQGAQLRRWYWSRKKRVLWSEGYFASTVGEVSREKVLEYVRDQAK